MNEKKVRAHELEKEHIVVRLVNRCVVEFNNYDIKNNTVYTEQMKKEKGLTDLFYLTDLIRYNSPEEVKKTVYKFLWL